MKLRSLDTDSTKITLGAALLLINAYLEKENGSTPYRIEFFDAKNNRRFSIEGNKEEMAIIDCLYKINGPTRPLEMLAAIPASFKLLHERKTSSAANQQGIVHVLENIFHQKIPQFWESNARAFNKWLKEFELEK